MSELIIWTYDWVPKGPRGFVRDLRLRWACEEAGLAYSVRTVPFDGRETNHLSRQPFGQVPFLSDGELEVFESGVALRRDVRPGAFRGGKFSDPASSQPRSARSIDPALSRDKSLPARRLSWASLSYWPQS